MSSSNPKYEPAKIIDNLYLGSKISAHDKSLLEEFNIKAIVNCALEIENKFEQDFNYLSLKCDDDVDEKITDAFPKAFTFMHDNITNDKAVFVHCQAGISRSATVIIGYLIKYHDYTLKKAFLHCKSCRPQIQPNIGFMEALQQFEKTHFKIDQPTFNELEYYDSVFEGMGFGPAEKRKAFLQKYKGYSFDLMVGMWFTFSHSS